MLDFISGFLMGSIALGAVTALLLWMSTLVITTVVFSWLFVAVSAAIGGIYMGIIMFRQ